MQTQEWCVQYWAAVNINPQKNHLFVSFQKAPNHHHQDQAVQKRIRKDEPNATT